MSPKERKESTAHFRAASRALAPKDTLRSMSDVRRAIGSTLEAHRQRANVALAELGQALERSHRQMCTELYALLGEAPPSSRDPRREP